MLPMQIGDQLKDGVRRAVVEIAGGLVRQQYFRLRDQSPGQRHSLLLPAGKFAGAVVRSGLEFHFAQPLQRSFFGLVTTHASNQQWHGRIFQRREFRKQVVELPGVSDFAITKFGGRFFLQPGHVAPGKHHAAVRRAVERSQNVEQSAFARAARSYQSQHFSRPYLKRQVVKERNLPRSGAEGFAQALNREDCRLLS